MTSLRHLTISAAWLIAIALTGTASNGLPPEQKQIFHQDLRPFGFITEARGQIVANYTDLNFLTDNLILVTVNNRGFGPVEKSFSDQPVSKLLLFDISQSRLAKTAEMAVEKSTHSVRALDGGRFVVLNETGLRACSRELDCGLPIATGGPLLVSPEGTKIVVGGDGQKEQTLLDGKTFRELARYSYENASVIPGDRALLFAHDRKIYAQVPGQVDRQLPFEGVNGSAAARFINHDTVIGFESDTALAVVKLDGTILFRVPVQSRWHLTEVSASASGTRFCLHEGGYTPWNSFVNFFDIDNGRPLNLESVNIISANSGASLFRLAWDPRPFIGIPTTPALSPNGQRLAVIRHGILEIFEIP